MRLKHIAERYTNGLIRKIYHLVRPKNNPPITLGITNLNEYAEFMRIVRDHTMVAPGGLASLYEQALYCEVHKIKGAFVECGVWKGGSVGLMALVNLRHATSRRHIHLFDAFQEICEPDEAVDGERALRETRAWAVSAGTKGRLVPLRGFYDHKGGPGTVKNNQELLENTIGYDPGYLHYHVGWFQDTLPSVSQEIGEIAILRLDADWYASTRICLDYLFARVVKGGFVIIDDYGAYDGCRKAVDEFLAGIEKPFYLNYVNQDIRYIIVS